MRPRIARGSTAAMEPSPGRMESASSGTLPQVAASPITAVKGYDGRKISRTMS